MAGDSDGSWTRSDATRVCGPEAVASRDTAAACLRYESVQAIRLIWAALCPKRGTSDFSTPPEVKDSTLDITRESSLARPVKTSTAFVVKGRRDGVRQWPPL